MALLFIEALIKVTGSGLTIFVLTCRKHAIVTRLTDASTPGEAKHERTR